ncbi:hypothetical protein AB1E18_016164 [Capra hircus]
MVLTYPLISVMTCLHDGEDHTPGLRKGGLSTDDTILLRGPGMHIPRVEITAAFFSMAGSGKRPFGHDLNCENIPNMFHVYRLKSIFNEWSMDRVEVCCKLPGAASATRSPVPCSLCRVSSFAAAGTRPPAARCPLSRPSGPGAKRGGGQPRRPWTAGAEEPLRSPWPSRLFALFPGKAGEERGTNQKRERRG